MAGQVKTLEVNRELQQLHELVFVAKKAFNTATEAEVKANDAKRIAQRLYFELKDLLEDREKALGIRPDEHEQGVPA